MKPLRLTGARHKSLPGKPSETNLIDVLFLSFNLARPHFKYTSNKNELSKIEFFRKELKQEMENTENLRGNIVTLYNLIVPSLHF